MTNCNTEGFRGDNHLITEVWMQVQTVDFSFSPFIICKAIIFLLSLSVKHFSKKIPQAIKTKLEIVGNKVSFESIKIN